LGRHCTVCTHPDHVAIDKKLAGGHEAASLARKYSLEPTSVRRHKASHLVRPRTVGEVGSDAEFAAWLEQRNLETPADVLAYAKHCVWRIDRLAEKAEADGDLSTAVRAITATLKSMETLFGKVTGLISDSPTIDASTKVIAVLSSLSEQQLRAFLAGGKDVMALRAE
jgi:hypothetical protein